VEKIWKKQMARSSTRRTSQTSIRPMALLRSLRGKQDLLLAVDVPPVRERITTVAAAVVGVRDLEAVVVAVDLVREANARAKS
jgi:hypothetical protein